MQCCSLPMSKNMSDRCFFFDYKTRLYRCLRKHYYEVEPAHAPASAESTVISARYSVDDLETFSVRRSVNFGAELRSGKRTSLFRIPARATITMDVADGSNPAAVIVPLHRVIASNGYLESRACDLHCKRPLLKREKAIAAKVQVPEQRTEITLERRP